MIHIYNYMKVLGEINKIEVANFPGFSVGTFLGTTSATIIGAIFAFAFSYVLARSERKYRKKEFEIQQDSQLNLNRKILLENIKFQSLLKCRDDACKCFDCFVIMHVDSIFQFSTGHNHLERKLSKESMIKFTSARNTFCASLLMIDAKGKIEECEQGLQKCIKLYFSVMTEFLRTDYSDNPEGKKIMDVFSEDEFYNMTKAHLQEMITLISDELQKISNI